MTSPYYIVFVEIPATSALVTCYRDSEHVTRAEAYTRLQAILPQHGGCLVWIETAHTAELRLDDRRYNEVPKP